MLETIRLIVNASAHYVARLACNAGGSSRGTGAAF
jgi:hypothetical protein